MTVTAGGRFAWKVTEKEFYAQELREWALKIVFGIVPELLFPFMIVLST